MPDLKPALEAIATLRKQYGRSPICCGCFLPGHPGDGFMQPPDGPECCQSPDGDVNTLCDVIANALQAPACNGVSAESEREAFEAKFSSLNLSGYQDTWRGRWVYRAEVVDAIWEGWLARAARATPPAPAPEPRETEMVELLRAARAIAQRRGEGTAWERFDASIAALGIGAITARTYRVLPSDDAHPAPVPDPARLPELGDVAIVAIDTSKINHLMLNGMVDCIAAARRARWTNVVTRKDGVERTWEADWLMHLQILSTETARALVTAATPPAPGGGLPEGWVGVPLEPTEAIRNAGVRELFKAPRDRESRELLEAAAKAAGIEVVGDRHPTDGLNCDFSGHVVVWRPLIDDGDAFRLAVKLRIDIPWQTFTDEQQDQEMAMIRSAIVRTAAALGGFNG